MANSTWTDLPLRLERNNAVWQISDVVITFCRALSVSLVPPRWDYVDISVVDCESLLVWVYLP